MDDPIQPDAGAQETRPAQDGRRRLKDRHVDDPEGIAWMGEARRRWRAAEAVSPDSPILAYEALELPDFRASVPVHVGREILGRFLQDRDTGVVHDTYSATPECGIDAIRNGTFFHFWEEVKADAAEDTPCSLCIP